MNSELVYPISSIFDDSTIDGALGRYQAKCYFIAPYQRGYKWSSENKSGAVNILLTDLFKAYHAQGKEYFLQYITTQANVYNSIEVLEVIDGQQRLTTLTLLFAVMASLTGDDQINFVKGKLLYQVRPTVSTFFSKFVYGEIAELFEIPWGEFLDVYPENNEQDIYYLFRAIQRIYRVLAELGEDLSVLHFAHYVAKNVKIILNNIDGNISCEKIFTNLNTNKVELTDVELIKGLLLTKAAREDLGQRTPMYKEVVEIRALLGRQWDEIVAWTVSPDVKALFFRNTGSPIYQLLYLVAIKHDLKESKDDPDKFILFNFFQGLIEKGSYTASDLFKELKATRSILNNWFLNDGIYNALGFIFFSKKSGITIYTQHSLLEKSLKEVEQKLRRKAFKLLPEKTSDLVYKDDDKEVHRVLLALSVFSGKERFNFTAFSKELWSLEHIFPQNPEDLPAELQKADIDLINELLIMPLTNKPQLLKRFGKINFTHLNAVRGKLGKDKCRFSDDEKKLVFRLIKTDQLNLLGNMALLTSRDNSSNGNGMFNEKRHNIVNRISNGSFVPKHTYDVFAKLISDKMTKTTAAWSDKDITVHQEWITNKIVSLRKDLLK